MPKSGWGFQSGLVPVSDLVRNKIASAHRSVCRESVEMRRNVLNLKAPPPDIPLVQRC